MSIENGVLYARQRVESSMKSANDAEHVIAILDCMLIESSAAVYIPVAWVSSQSSYVGWLEERRGKT
jgi:hypothetical protein